MNASAQLKLSITIIILGFAPGCGKPGYPTPVAAPTDRGAAPARSAHPLESTSQGEATVDYDAAEAPPASASAPEARRESQEMARERPGLGTVFGERRTSAVSHRSFLRASATPFAMMSVFYNDREGIKAQMQYRGGEDPAPIHAYTPAGGISVALQDGGGEVLPGISAGGRTYVVGQEGERYSIVVQNQTGGLFEVVISVDGLDVIDGRTAQLAKRGYLLEPHGTLVIDGYRISNEEVAAFRFGRVSDSYAARTQGDRHVGVIGLGFFAERGSVWTHDELRRRETANPFPGTGRYAVPPPFYH